MIRNMDSVHTMKLHAVNNRRNRKCDIFGFIKLKNLKKDITSMDQTSDEVIKLRIDDGDTSIDLNKSKNRNKDLKVTFKDVEQIISHEDSKISTEVLLIDNETRKEVSKV